MTRIAIVGASLAGAHAARAIRAAGFDDEVLVVGDENHLPYDRPPLSKQFLTTNADDGHEYEKLKLRVTKEPGALDLRWRIGAKASQLDLDERALVLATGERIDFDGLVVATGSRARLLPHLLVPVEVAGRVCSLRTIDDAVRIKQLLPSDPGRLVICGAGFIGLEVASSARELGHDVSVVDVAATPLSRVMNREAAMAVADLHRGHGVDLRLGVGLSTVATDGKGSRVATVATDGKGSRVAVGLSDGSELTADLVVIGVGASPDVDWLEGNGFDLSNGLKVDPTCAAAPTVVAAGDVARWPNELYDGQYMRIEQWDNAVEMGAFAGTRLVAALNGESGYASFAPVPWFWSDQFGQKIQLAGLVTPDSQIVIGKYGDDRVVELFSNQRGVLVGALAWNRPRHAILARQLIADRASLDDAVEKLAG